MFVNTSRYQDVNLDQKEITKMDNADMVILECVYTSRPEGVKRGNNAIFTMEGKEAAVGQEIQTSTSPMILMETGTIQIAGLRKEIFIKKDIPHRDHHILIF